MATHSSILAWEIPWTEETGRLQYKGSQSDMTKHTHIYIQYTYILEHITHIYIMIFYIYR